jgi:hypothetical protein
MVNLKLTRLSLSFHIYKAKRPLGDKPNKMPIYARLFCVVHYDTLRAQILSTPKLIQSDARLGKAAARLHFLFIGQNGYESITWCHNARVDLHFSIIIIKLILWRTA